MLRKILIATAIILGLSLPATAQVIPFSLGPQPIPPQALLPLTNIWTAPNIFGSGATGSFNIGGLTAPSLEELGTTSNTSSAALGRWSADANSSDIFTYKSRGATVGTSGAAVAGDIALRLGAFVDDATTTGGLEVAELRLTNCATLTGGTSAPGCMYFFTMSAGGTLTRQFGIDDAGALCFNPGSITTGVCPTGNVFADQSGFLYAAALKGQGSIPTATGTGTPVVTTGSTDLHGSVTAGTSATSIVITSGQTGYATVPFCVVAPVTQLVAFSAPVTLSAGHFVITVTQTATSGDLVSWWCGKNT